MERQFFIMVASVLGFFGIVALVAWMTQGFFWAFLLAVATILGLFLGLYGWVVSPLQKALMCLEAQESRDVQKRLQGEQMVRKLFEQHAWLKGV